MHTKYGVDDVQVADLFKQSLQGVLAQIVSHCREGHATVHNVGRIATQLGYIVYSTGYPERGSHGPLPCRGPGRSAPQHEAAWCHPQRW